MPYLEGTARAESVEEDYVLIPRGSSKDGQPTGYYVVDMSSRKPWLIVKTCCVCGNDHVWMREVLMSLTDSIDRRVVECPGCRSLLRFKPDGTDLTERVEPEEATEQPEREVSPVETASLPPGKNGLCLPAGAATLAATD
ncbi:MAG: hypothetical protein OEY99_02480 [Aigarchaeota archaeon]|nr:hypothetical protein [Aigarchaeota archaeon]MDH5703056.1 hypothetical protein [Aigarchaeota archaeon]